jgi:hypothetical protein
MTEFQSLNYTPACTCFISERRFSSARVILHNTTDVCGMPLETCPRPLEVWEGFQKSLTYCNIKNKAISQAQDVVLGKHSVFVT